MREKLYPPVHTTYLRSAAMLALQEVAAELKNPAVKVFDGYRPYAVKEKMWKAVKDDRYAAGAAKGSCYNQEIAAEPTLVSVNTKKELSMGIGLIISLILPLLIYIATFSNST